MCLKVANKLPSLMFYLPKFPEITRKGSRTTNQKEKVSVFVRFVCVCVDWKNYSQPTSCSQVTGPRMSQVVSLDENCCGMGEHGLAAHIKPEALVNPQWPGSAMVQAEGATSLALQGVPLGTSKASDMEPPALDAASVP